MAPALAEVDCSICAQQDYLRWRGVPRQPTDLLEHDLIGGDLDDETLNTLLKY